jgi:hypothetical protein
MNSKRFRSAGTREPASFEAVAAEIASEAHSDRRIGRSQAPTAVRRPGGDWKSSPRSAEPERGCLPSAASGTHPSSGDPPRSLRLDVLPQTGFLSPTVRAGAERPQRVSSSASALAGLDTREQIARIARPPSRQTRGQGRRAWRCSSLRRRRHSWQRSEAGPRAPAVYAEPQSTHSQSRGPLRRAAL